MRISFAAKLPPRFKIFHNVSEDYYFIKERFCFFWYITEKRDIGYGVPTEIARYPTIEEAESTIEWVLEAEKQSSIPDKIKLVKTL